MNELKNGFLTQRSAYAKNPYPTYEERKQQLAKLAKSIYQNRYKLAEAVSKDFGHRSIHETLLLEIFPSLENIHYMERNLKKWMKPQKRKVSVWFQPGRAEVLNQPLGVVGVIVPWNYPVYLAIGPLVAAMAAGNRVLIKISEYTPHTGEILKEILSPLPVFITGGGPEIGQYFTELPLDHLLFTGSTAVGRQVMKAASSNLTPVTLELGGKSPAIIGRDYSIAKAAEQIMVGKLLNAGQTCIAPDYVLVPEELLASFIENAKKAVSRLYPTFEKNPDYSAIINDKHLTRLQELLEDAKSKGAFVGATGRSPSLASQKFCPILLTGVTSDMRVMKEEIFGPILPVMTYKDLSEAINYVNSHPRPLALYYFDRDKNNIEKVLKETVSGGVTINDTLLHIAQDDLPFGGVGFSGMGHYHGKEGFETFSKQKAIFYQSRWSASRWLYPPYTQLKRKLIEFMLKN